METGKLTVRLPKTSLDFAKQYAEAHQITVTELIDRYLRSLREVVGPTSCEVEKISGLIPIDADVEAEYREHLRAKV